MNKQKILLLALAVWCLTAAFSKPANKITVYTIGDSTMANKDTTGGNPERGWAMAFQPFFDANKVVVENHAMNGRSTKSFIDEGRWKVITDKLKKGDYVFIQFGHNDEKIEDPARYADAQGAYKANLTRYVEETRAKKAHPVLMTPIIRRRFDSSGVLVNTHDDYPDAVRTLAKELNVPFIDMEEKTRQLVQSMGPEESKSLFLWLSAGQSAAHPNGIQDNTHLNERGAFVVAQEATKGIRELNLPIVKYLKEQVVAAQGNHRFQFNKDGKFKIAQFTDIHWIHGEPTCEQTAATIKAVLAAEKPDIAILTGDVAWRSTSREPWTVIPKIFEEAKIPFAVVFGNHDDGSSSQISRPEIMDILVKSPYFVGEKGPEDISGCGNYILPVHASKSDKVSALLYCIDSQGYSRNKSLGDYEPVHFDQIKWYRQQSEKFTAANGGKPLPALAFFHIPLPEYNNIIGKKNTVGTHGEKLCPPGYNTGLFASFIDKQDVMGVFVGHDHDNDYIGIEYYIALAYGRVSGYGGYGKPERGARIISLYEDEFAFDSWIRTPSGTELTFYFPSGISSVDEETMTYLPAKKGNSKKQGIRYTYYEGDFGSVKKISPDKKAGEGTMKYFSVNDAPSEDYFAYEFRTWIKIPEKGVYSFYTISDDGSQLYVDDQLVVDKDWSHIVRMDGKVALEAGFHELKVLYYEATWGQKLEIGYSSKKIRDQKLPENSLFIPEK